MRAFWNKLERASTILFTPLALLSKLMTLFQDKAWTDDYTEISPLKVHKEACQSFTECDKYMKEMRDETHEYL